MTNNNKPEEIGKQIERSCLHEKIYLMNCVQKKGSYEECESESNPFLTCAFNFALNLSIQTDFGEGTEEPKYLDYKEYKNLKEKIKQNFKKIWVDEDVDLKNPNTLVFQRKSCYSSDYLLNSCHRKSWSKDKKLTQLCNEQQRRLVSCMLKNSGHSNEIFNICWKNNYKKELNFEDSEKLARTCLDDQTRLN
eukprot:gene5024-8621_t